MPRKDLKLDDLVIYETEDSKPFKAKAPNAIISASLEAPKYLDGEVPTILIPGYGGIRSAYYQLRSHMARYGKPAVSYKAPRRQNGLGDLNPSYILRPEGLQVEAVTAIMDHLADEFGYEQFDLSGHSMGGWIAALAAAEQPERVRSVVFNASVGLEPHNALTLAPRARNFAGRDGELRREISEKRVMDAGISSAGVALRALEYVLTNPLRTFAEGLAVSRADVRPIIPELRQRGIRTAIIVYQSDVLVQADQVGRHSADLVDVFATFPVTEAGHTGPQCYPVEGAQLHVDLAQHWFGPYQKPDFELDEAV